MATKKKSSKKGSKIKAKARRKINKTKLISHGTNFSDFTGTKHWCLACGCEFEVGKNADVYPHKTEIFIGGEEQTVELRAHKCPDCGADVILNYPEPESA
jgi:hypothetical protein